MSGTKKANNLSTYFMETFLSTIPEEDEKEIIHPQAGAIKGKYQVQENSS